MINHQSVKVGVKLSSNRTTITVGRSSLGHVSKKQSVKDQAKVKRQVALKPAARFPDPDRSYRQQPV